MSRCNKGVLGLDPGLRGAAAIIFDDGSVWYEPMPTLSIEKGEILNIPELKCMLQMRKEAISCAFLEKVSAMPGQGVSSTFKFGRTYGAIEAVLSCLEIPYQLVTPQKWTKVLHAGVEGGDPKQRSLIAVTRLFPGISLTIGKGRKPHDGIVDALMIAEYGRRSNLQCDIIFGGPG